MENEYHLSRYLTCERYWVFELLMLSAGMMGAYTFIMRGGVFCNAQTANVVLMAVEFGQRHWQNGFYYFIPITAYLVGTMISEILPSPIKKLGLFRWDTYLIGFEIIVLFVIGLLPLTVPNQIVQVSINFIASMQYNTFRQAEGEPMATTFCTNHIRQTGVGFAKYLRKHDTAALRVGLRHLKMIALFFLGGMIVSVLCGLMGAKTIWIAILPLGVIFGILVYADRVPENDELYKKPRGH